MPIIYSGSTTAQDCHGSWAKDSKNPVRNTGIGTNLALQNIGKQLFSFLSVVVYGLGEMPEAPVEKLTGFSFVLLMLYNGCSPT